MAERTCIIHIGTHKTGTTALQAFFYDNKDALRGAGVHLSDVGRYENSPGNHSIAWDMLATGNSPHFSGLLDDLRRSETPTSLITSEDFSLLHVRPDALNLIARGLRSIGYRALIVVYLRSQAAFAESMYSERIKHGYVRALGTYVRTILNTGSYIPDNSEIHLEFQYSRLLAPFVEVFGKNNILVRPYTGHARPAQIYNDFFSVFLAANGEFAKTPARFRVQNNRANESLTFIQLLHTAHWHIRNGDVVQDENTANALAALARDVAPGLPDELLMSRFSLITREETLQFLERFSTDNQFVEREYGARIPFMSTADVAPENDPRWARTRLQRVVFDRLLERWMAEAEQTA